MIEIKRYSVADKQRWDAFCASSLNGVFLFFRDYMDYHSDRFFDHSLLFYRGKAIVALLPCNECAEEVDGSSRRVLNSHGGLTFGSFIMGRHSHQLDMMECVEVLKNYCREQDIARVYLKPVPILLQTQPSEQDVFALIHAGAQLEKAEPSIVVRIAGYAPRTEEARYISRACSAQLKFKQCDSKSEWRDYHAVLSHVLDKYHHAKPVHSLPELELLRSRFPENIKLYAVYEGEEMVAGSVVYLYNRTVHTQYMAANERGREKYAMHYCLHKLIEEYHDMEWLDFGTSMLNRGTEPDRGLISFKEGFKGNSLLYIRWSLKI